MLANVLRNAALVLTCLVIASIPARAATIAVPPVQINVLSHTFTAGKAPTGNVITDGVTFPSGPGSFSGPGFTATLGTGDEIVIRFETTGGLQFAPVPVSGAGPTTLSISAYWQSSGAPGSPAFVPAAVTWIGLIGPAPTTLVSQGSVSTSTRRIDINAQFEAASAFRFDAVEFRFNIGSGTTVSRTFEAVSSEQSPSYFARAQGVAIADQPAMRLQLPVGECVTCADTEGESASAPCLTGLNHGCFSSQLLGDPVGVVPDEGHGFGTITPGVVMCGKLSREPYPTGLERDVDTFLFEVGPDGAHVIIDWLAEVEADVGLGRLGPNPSTPCAGFTFLLTTAIGGMPPCGTSVLRTPPDALPVVSRLEYDAAPGTYFVLIAKHGGSGDANVVLCAEEFQYKLRVTIVPTACPADTNGDSVVNGADLSVLLSQFGQSVTPGSGADFNGDGSVNGADLSVLLGQFGSAC